MIYIDTRTILNAINVSHRVCATLLISLDNPRKLHDIDYAGLAVAVSIETKVVKNRMHNKANSVDICNDFADYTKQDAKINCPGFPGVFVTEITI